MQQLLQYILHIDTYLFTFVTAYGIWAYVALFAIIFCETGLVITPFLPGDSLLFAAGSIAASASHTLSMQLLLATLITASILGNKLNYLIGKMIGPRIFSIDLWFLNKKRLAEAHAFYEKHGGKTIILARFIPIIRTFVPFVAGVADMSLKQFSAVNIVSAILWIGSMLGAGYCFGTLPFVRDHFSLVIYSIVTLTLLPPLISLMWHRTHTTTAAVIDRT